MTQLERLEKKLGVSPRTLGHHELVCEQALNNPESLTALDLATLEYFGTPRDVETAITRVKRSEESQRQVALDAADTLRRQGALPSAAPAAPPTLDEEFLEAIAHAIVDTVKDAITPLKARLDALETDEHTKAFTTRIDRLEQCRAALEARPALSDAGIWKAGVTYEVGDIVTARGGAWVCTSKHYSTGAGVDSAYFRLMIRHGRDGKDAQ